MSLSQNNHTGLASVGDTDDVNQLAWQVRAIWIQGYVEFQFHIAGTLFVLLRAYWRWKRFGVLSMAQRLPFYIAIIDFILYFVYLTNGFPILAFGHTYSGVACGVVGALVFFFVSSNMVLVGTVAFTTYLRVCRQAHIDFGRYDWKLLLIVIVCPASGVLIGIPAFGTGTDTYWCYADRTKIYLSIIDILLYFGILGTCAFSYFSVILALRKAKKNLMDNSRVELPTAAETAQARIVRKVASYILMFILTWGPSMFYLIGTLINYLPFWVYVVTMHGYAWGGFLNGIQYCMNEGLRDPQEDDEADARNQRDDVEMDRVSEITNGTNAEERGIWSRSKKERRKKNRSEFDSSLSSW